MADIVTTRIFQDGEKNITAAKLNDIVASSTIQPAFVSSKPSTSTVATTDNLLVLQTAGTYAKAPFQTVIDSVNAGLNTDTEIWSVRLRSFNAVGNPTFEVDQRNAGATVTNLGASGWLQDRYGGFKTGTMTVNGGQNAGIVKIPGTNFNITRNFQRITLTAQETSLGASDVLHINQFVEGPVMREILGDVTSISLIVRSSVASLKFGVVIGDSGSATTSLAKLATTSATPNTWSLIQFPNIPVFPAGNFSTGPGLSNQFIRIVLAAGASLIPPANDTWQGAFNGAVGQDNFASKPVNSTFDIAFLQWEPGPVCSTPMDCPFTMNYDSAQRYFFKTYDYAVAPGTVSNNGSRYQVFTAGSVTVNGVYTFPKPMAKVPTVTSYSRTTGAINSTNTSGAGVVSCSVSSNIGQGGFIQITLSSGTGVTAGSEYAQFIADTSW